jgi:hypothetical protein
MMILALLLNMALADETRHYNANGELVGTTENVGFGQVDHRDENGVKTGHSTTDSFGATDHYNADGERVGTSYESEY